MATSPGRGAAASRRRWRALDGLGALAICVATLALSNGRVVDATSIYSVCLVQNPGFVACTPGTSDPASFSGYDVDVIQYVAGLLGWNYLADPGVNGSASFNDSVVYRLVCQPDDVRVGATLGVLLNSSALAFEQCAMGAGAVTVTSARMNSGVRFSWPHMHTSLGVIFPSRLQQTQEETNPWSFMKPFSVQVWVAILLTMIATPTVIVVAENLIVTGHLPISWALADEWRHACYTMFLCCFNLQVLEVLSFPCQVIIVAFAFTNLIFVASYTANLAAALTATAINTGIQTLSDLQGYNVAAHPVYIEPLLKNEHISTWPLTWGGELFFLDLMDRLKRGNVDAFIFDKPLLTYYMLKDDQTCELTMLKEDNIVPFDYGVAFHVNFPAPNLWAFSTGILQAQATGMLDHFKQRYLGAEQGRACSAPTAQGNNSGEGLQLAQMLGLYVIMGAAGILAFIWAICSVCWIHVYQPRRARRRALKEQQKKQLQQLEQDAQADQDGLQQQSSHGGNITTTKAWDPSGHPSERQPSVTSVHVAAAAAASAAVPQPLSSAASADSAGTHAAAALALAAAGLTGAVVVAGAVAAAQDPLTDNAGGPDPPVVDSATSPAARGTQEQQEQQEQEQQGATGDAAAAAAVAVSPWLLARRAVPQQQEAAVELPPAAAPPAAPETQPPAGAAAAAAAGAASAQVASGGAATVQAASTATQWTFAGLATLPLAANAFASALRRGGSSGHQPKASSAAPGAAAPNATSGGAGVAAAGAGPGATGGPAKVTALRKAVSVAVSAKKIAGKVFAAPGAHDASAQPAPGSANPAANPAAAAGAAAAAAAGILSVSGAKTFAGSGRQRRNSSGSVASANLPLASADGAQAMQLAYAGSLPASLARSGSAAAHAAAAAAAAQGAPPWSPGSPGSTAAPADGLFTLLPSPNGGDAPPTSQLSQQPSMEHLLALYQHHSAAAAALSAAVSLARQGSAGSSAGGGSRRFAPFSGDGREPGQRRSSGLGAPLGSGAAPPPPPQQQPSFLRVGSGAAAHEGGGAAVATRLSGIGRGRLPSGSNQAVGLVEAQQHQGCSLAPPSRLSNGGGVGLPPSGSGWAEEERASGGARGSGGRQRASAGWGAVAPGTAVRAAAAAAARAAQAGGSGAEVLGNGAVALSTALSGGGGGGGGGGDARPAPAVAGSMVVVDEEAGVAVAAPGANGTHVAASVTKFTTSLS